MTVIVVPTVLLWILAALFALNGAATLYRLWLARQVRLRNAATGDACVDAGGGRQGIKGTKG